jgi:hypothetical protein
VLSELIEIEEKLDDFQIKISNLDKKVSELIEFSRNLSKIWYLENMRPNYHFKNCCFQRG